MIACAAGWCLDGFDMTGFSYVITGLITVNMVTKPQAGVLGTAALLSSSLGGWLTGILCDRYGRVRMLQVTILWFSIFTGLCGLAQNYHQMLVLRSLQGLGFGGEWTAGAVLMGEVIRAKYRGRAVGIVQGAVGIGYMLAALAYGVVFSVLPVQWSWRALFWVGVLPAFLVIYVRRAVQEPEIFRTTQSKSRFEMFGFLKGNLLLRTIIASIMLTGLQGSYYVVAIWLPQFLKGERHMTVVGTSTFSMIVLTGSLIGFFIGAHTSDYFGRRPTIIFFALGSAFASYIYTVLPITPFLMVFLGVVMGAMNSGKFTPLGALLTELYPTAMRGSAQGFVYNGGRAIGALVPAIAGFASARMKLGVAIGVLAAISNGLAILACLLLPETRNQELSVLDVTPQSVPADPKPEKAASADIPK
jgi:MFS family permease